MNAEMRSVMSLLNPSAPVALLADAVHGPAGFGPEEDEEGPRDTTAAPQMSSHDALGYCIDVQARRNEMKENKERRAVQEAIYKRYRLELMALQLPAVYDETNEAVVRETGVRVYELMCRFVRSNLRSFFPKCGTMRFAFASIDDISARIKTNVARYLAGREILQGVNPDATMNDHVWKSIHRLYCECAAIVQDYERLPTNIEEDEREQHPLQGEGRMMMRDDDDEILYPSSSPPAAMGNEDEVQELLKALGIISPEDNNHNNSDGCNCAARTCSSAM